MLALDLIILAALLLTAAVFLLGGRHPEAGAAACPSPTNSLSPGAPVMPVSCLP